jgi:hypothetical protein
MRASCWQVVLLLVPSILKSFRTGNIRAVAAMGEILYLLIWKTFSYGIRPEGLRKESTVPGVWTGYIHTRLSIQKCEN